MIPFPGYGFKCLAKPGLICAGAGKQENGITRRLGIDPGETPAALAVHHGPFAWGQTVEKAVEHAVTLEAVAEMAERTLTLNPVARMNPAMTEKHYSRKHGPSAYYGQR